MTEERYKTLETTIKWVVIVGLWSLIGVFLLGVYALADLVI